MQPLLYTNDPRLYNMDVAEISVSDARARLPEVIEQARDEAVYVTRHGKTQAVIVSPAHYARLLDALEERDDIRAFDVALSEEGDDVPWDQVKADLGWE